MVDASFKECITGCISKNTDQKTFGRTHVASAETTGYGGTSVEALSAPQKGEIISQGFECYSRTDKQHQTDIVIHKSLYIPPCPGIRSRRHESRRRKKTGPLISLKPPTLCRIDEPLHNNFVQQLGRLHGQLQHPRQAPDISPSRLHPNESEPTRDRGHRHQLPRQQDLLQPSNSHPSK